ncbi:MAG TPA: DUF2007 domain-containing protein [Armatimonadota bacterium]|jgi:hypothetical protein
MSESDRGVSEVVYRTPDEWEAGLVEGWLRGAGIPVMAVARGLTAYRLGAPMVPSSPGVEISVPASRAEDARRILAEMMPDESAPDEAALPPDL